MEYIQNIAQYGWGGAAAIVVGLLFLLFQRRARKEDGAKEEAKRRYNAYVAAVHEWQDYMDSGEIVAAAKVAEEIETMKNEGWNIAPVLAFALLIAVCGCATRKQPEPEPEVVTVLLTDHFRIASPGDTVPALPYGEPRWYLATPTGMKHLLPSDAPINRLGGKEQCP